MLLFSTLPLKLILFSNIIPNCDAIIIFHTFTVSSVDVTINVVSSRQGTFTVTCTASGGTVVSSSLTGHGGVDLELQPVGSIGRTGQNTYSVTSGTLSGRSNGDTYQCTAAAVVLSPHLSDSTVLRGKFDIIAVHSTHNVFCNFIFRPERRFNLNETECYSDIQIYREIDRDIRKYFNQFSHSLLHSSVATDPTIMSLALLS